MAGRALYRPGTTLRTGLTHFFERRATADRAAASRFWAESASGAFSAPTPGVCPGFVQTNMVCVQKEHAYDFLQFCLRNPQPCPVLDISEVGVPEASLAAPGADLRNVVPKYRVWRDGLVVQECPSVEHVWAETGDMVCFLLGCSFSWEDKLTQAGLVPRHAEMGCNVPMYRTNVKNAVSGPFGGELVVSMRPYRKEEIAEVQFITGKYPGAHGPPVHWGDPAEIGIGDLSSPDYGDPVEFKEGELPVFWACGVTPQTALEAAKLPVAVTHSPGFMMVCDLLDDELLVDASVMQSFAGFEQVATGRKI